MAGAEERVKELTEELDEVSRRCLALEKSLLKFREQSIQNKSGRNYYASCLAEAAIFYDCGKGFNEDHKILSVPVFLEDGRIALSFELPEKASALRFDPGELSCYIADLEVSDDAVVCVPFNGTEITERNYLFLDSDPVFMVEGRSVYDKGKITFSFYYDRTEVENEDFIKQIKLMKERQGAEQKKLEDIWLEERKKLEDARLEEQKQKEAYRSFLAQEKIKAEKYEKGWMREKERADECGRSLMKEQSKAAEVLRDRDSYKKSLEDVLQSKSWKMTAPLRGVLEMFRKGN